MSDAMIAVQWLTWVYDALARLVDVEGELEVIESSQMSQSESFVLRRKRIPTVQAATVKC